MKVRHLLQALQPWSTHTYIQFTALHGIVALALIGVTSAYVAAPLEARVVLASDSASSAVWIQLPTFII